VFEERKYIWKKGDAYMVMKYESLCDYFGTSPVRDAYWGWNTPPNKHANTMVFRRYPNLLPEKDRDILVKALLGNKENVGYRFSNNNAILNDSWVVNLRTTGENILMETLLKQLREQLKEAVEQHEGKMVQGDVTEELHDLRKVYVDAEKSLKEKEAYALKNLQHYMKQYIEAAEETKKITFKLKILESKLHGEKQDDEGDDE